MFNPGKWKDLEVFIKARFSSGFECRAVVGARHPMTHPSTSEIFFKTRTLRYNDSDENSLYSRAHVPVPTPAFQDRPPQASASA